MIAQVSHTDTQNIKCVKQQKSHKAYHGGVINKSKKQQMSGRVNVVLPDEIYKLVKELAEAERRSLSQMTAILVERGLTPRKDPPPSTAGASVRGGVKGRKRKVKDDKERSPND
jgi:CopG-like RHH_1 or ribbon-helix-helix domain, RHH_5